MGWQSYPGRVVEFCRVVLGDSLYAADKRGNCRLYRASTIRDVIMAGRNERLR